MAQAVFDVDSELFNDGMFNYSKMLYKNLMDIQLNLIAFLKLFFWWVEGVLFFVTIDVGPCFETTVLIVYYLHLCQCYVSIDSIGTAVDVSVVIVLTTIVYIYIYVCVCVLGHAFV